MAKDELRRTSVYKLEIENLQDLNLDSYTIVKEGESRFGDISYIYKIAFFDARDKEPPWYGVFKGILATTPHEPPYTRNSGFFMALQIEGNIYAITGGITHLHLKKLPIRHRFGIELAEKIISQTELSGLIQKDTSGILNHLDRIFRGPYDPRGEIDNLKRILTNIRGRLSKENQYYDTVGKSIQASDGLTVSGTKKFDELIAFIFEVHKLDAAPRGALHIPQLYEIAKKNEAALLEELKGELAFTLENYDAESTNLFLDNEEIGYLPDRVDSYQLLFGGVRSELLDTYEEVFELVSEELQEFEYIEEQVEALEKMTLVVHFGGEAFEKMKLLKYICGDVPFEDEAYFTNNGYWYKANEEFLEKLNAEIDNLEFLTPDKLALNDWDEKNHSGSGGEFRFNESHHDLHLLDSRCVRIPGEKGPIEFCDLLEDGEKVRLIHVKKESGAALRALFAQGFVSGKLYSDSNEFQQLVHSASVDSAGKLSQDTKNVLQSLQNRQKREFQIVFAIYDEVSSHSVPKNAKKTTDYLDGTLTPFARVDLLDRVGQLRGLGYDVAITRIRPYPIKG